MIRREECLKVGNAKKHTGRHKKKSIGQDCTKCSFVRNVHLFETFKIVHTEKLVTKMPKKKYNRCSLVVVVVLVVVRWSLAVSVRGVHFTELRSYFIFLLKLQ